MTLLLAEGFDNSSSGLRKGPQGVSSTANAFWVPDEGLKGGGAFRINNNSSFNVNWMQFKWASTELSSITGYRISLWMKSNIPVTLSGEALFIGFETIFNTYGDQERINLQPGGYFDLRTSTNFTYSPFGIPFGSPFGQTPGVNVADGNWHHVNFSIRYADSGGRLGLRVDDQQYALFEGDTRGGVAYNNNNGPLALRIYNLRTATAGYMLIDDLQIWNDTDVGDGFANNYVPPQIITTLRPSADVSGANSAPSIGSDRWSLLNKIDANAQNGYVTLAPGKSDFYEFTNVPENANIRFVAVNMAYASANVASKANVRLLLTSNNFNAIGNTFTTQATSYALTYSAIFSNRDGYLAPRDFGNSNSFWTQTSANSILIGIENTGVP